MLCLCLFAGVQRYFFNAIVSAQDETETYLPAFQSCVERGKASGLMCSYNAVNGVPTCADPDIMTTKARNTWGFQVWRVYNSCAAYLVFESFMHIRFVFSFMSL